MQKICLKLEHMVFQMVPYFSSLGSENTFQGAPQILRQTGYTSAVFHGNTGTFWNRNEVYKNLGYNYFFDANYFSQKRTTKSDMA